MRALVLFMLAACATQSSSASCPAEPQDRQACGLPEGDGCLREKTFSPCLSEWCTCDNGQFECETIAPQDGESCDAAAFSSCSYEGVPSCDIQPTAEFCSCDADGTWHCICACYGTFTTCGTCPARYDSTLNGKGCEVDCDLGDHSCSCVVDGFGDRVFSCN